MKIKSENHHSAVWCHDVAVWCHDKNVICKIERNISPLHQKKR